MLWLVMAIFRPVALWISYDRCGHIYARIVDQAKCVACMTDCKKLTACFSHLEDNFHRLK